MNRSLLIIICDFLLISILALVEFHPAVTGRGVHPQALRDRAAEDMLELLQLSLEHENRQRAELEALLGENRERLGRTAAELAATGASLQRREAEAAELAASLQETRSSLQLTIEESAALARNLAANEERARRLQAELLEQQQLAARKAADLDAARDHLARLEAEQRLLSTELRIRDTEKAMLEQSLIAARAEVERARIEAERAQARTESLAAGVSEMAAVSTALQEQIRQAQALSLNAIYQQFADNRVLVRFDWEERLLLGSTARQTVIQSLLVDTGAGVYVLFATANTPLAGTRAANVAAVLSIGGRAFAIREVGFLAGEPAIAAVQVPPSLVRDSGLRVFTLAADPLRFASAVLVSDRQEAYGEIPIRVPPGEPGLLEVESRLFTRLFGEFSPSAGSYVFSLSGELLGIMVRANRARVVQAPTFGDFRELARPR